MEKSFSMEWKIFGKEWKKFCTMENKKIVFHSIACPADALDTSNKYTCKLKFVDRSSIQKVFGTIDWPFSITCFSGFYSSSLNFTFWYVSVNFFIMSVLVI